MKRILILLASLFFVGESFALPPCPTSGYFDNCYGTLTWGKGEWEGDKYVGEFKDNKRHGQGTYTHANGDKYVGEWKDDYRHGQGTGTWTNGDKYVGEWKDDKRWEGIHYLASGEVAGTYSNGKWCGVCKPTARQLAIVRAINSGQIAAIPTPAQNLTLTIRSSPTDAKVYIGGAYKGTTELKVKL
jgi:hypothetical protein